MGDRWTGAKASAEGERAREARERARLLSQRAVRAGKWSEAVVSETMELTARARGLALGGLRDHEPEPAVDQLWLAYVECGGRSSIGEFIDFLRGAIPLPPLERAILDHAVQEVLDGLGRGG